MAIRFILFFRFALILLVLDEITSQLDDKTEQKIIEELKKIKKNKLILFVTHNKKILDNFDDILYLDNND